MDHFFMSKAITYLNSALRAHASGNLEEAKYFYKKTLAEDSLNSTALGWLGAIEAQHKNYEIASDLLLKALAKEKNNQDFLLNYANILFETRQFCDAVIYYQKAIRQRPNDPICFANLAACYNRQGQPLLGLAAADQSIQLKSDYAEAWSDRANALQDLKRYEEALASNERALKLKPDYVEAWSNRANVLQDLKRYDEAIAHYDQALELKPDFAEAWSNKGNTLHELKRYDEAIGHYDHALDLKPNYAEAWSNKGLTLRELKRYDEAIAHYDQALDLRPDIDWVFGDLLHTKMKICSWLALSESLEIISKKVMANEKVANPFSLLALSDDPLLHQQCAKIYAQDRFPHNPALGPLVKSPASQKIRIGYFSADFYNHATGYLMAELFELHDKNQFDLIGFSFGPITNDEMRQRLKKTFDQFIEVGNKSDIEITQLCRNLNIDIAVDLKGFTQDSRTRIFSYRAVPIQVNYLGYPGTMGAEYMDYIVADITLIPPDSQSYYSEKVVYLPNSYQVNDRKRAISDKQFTRQDLGLPENEFVFCCFNNNYKILPATFASWMRILRAVDGSVLWLFKDNPLVVENLKKESGKQGIAANRLVFAERLPLPEHLARHRQADLFLDTLPYNAHTTASDALWTGLPVLTLMGQSFASRVAASLLNAIGLPELITNTQEEYEALAIELATNPQKLVEIKLKLANNRLTTPLFDTPLFTKNLEAAYLKIHERYFAGLPLECIYV
jgi:predicted O-linked N-acetylglucosamine transferase (SPINDLY family)